MKAKFNKENKKMEKKQGIISKRQRKLVKKQFVPSSTMSFDLPSGEVIKRIVFKIKGNYTHTYASGTPKPNTQLAGVAHALLRNIRILTDGGKLHKQIDVKTLRDQAKMVYGSDAPSVYENNNTVVEVDANGFASIGATTEPTAFLETFELPLECVISSSSAISYLNLAGQNSSVIEIDTHAIENLVKASDSVTYSDIAHDIKIEVQLTTAPHFAGNKFETFRQTSKTIDFKGAQNSTPVELNRGAKIAGFFLEMVKGQDRDVLTVDEFDRCEFQLVRNGTEVLRSFSGQELISENVSGTPLQTAIKSTGYVSLLNNRNIATALNTMVDGGVSALDLLVTLPSDLDYTYPVRLSIKQDEILPLI